MGNQLNKAAKITFNINCVICSLGAFYSIIGALRAIAGNASNPFSVIAAPSFVISLYALYLYYSQKKIGLYLFMIFEIIGGVCLSFDPDYPEDLIISLLVFVGTAVAQFLGTDHKKLN